MFEVKAKSLLMVPGAVRYSAIWEVPARIGLIIIHWSLCAREAVTIKN
jgi:hypothetical protein